MNLICSAKLAGFDEDRKDLQSSGFQPAKNDDSYGSLWMLVTFGHMVFDEKSQGDSRNRELVKVKPSSPSFQMKFKDSKPVQFSGAKNCQGVRPGSKNWILH